MTSAQNAYEKTKVLTACTAALKWIHADREAWKKYTASHKQHTWFGPDRTIEEAWNKLSGDKRVEILTMHSYKERLIARIVSATNKCIGHTVNLTNDEISYIIDFWPL
jgi:predicted Fe-S protein YdhL (DUF1289 family)